QEEIANLANEVENNPGARQAQKRLAEEMTKMVHSETALEQAIKISEALFSGNVKALTKAEIEQGCKDVPTFATKKMDVPLVDLLVEAKISSSKRQAREDITNGARYINGERKQDGQHTVTEANCLQDTYNINRRRPTEHD